MRKKLKPHDVDGFFRQYGRKAPRHGEPNDRHYSRQLEELIKHMDPWELDALMRGEDEPPMPSDDHEVNEDSGGTSESSDFDDGPNY